MYKYFFQPIDQERREINETQALEVLLLNTSNTPARTILDNMKDATRAAAGLINRDFSHEVVFRCNAGSLYTLYQEAP
jgi:hypothetical protein